MIGSEDQKAKTAVVAQRIMADPEFVVPETRVLTGEVPVTAPVIAPTVVEPNPFIPKTDHTPEYFFLLLCGLILNYLLKPIFKQVADNFKTNSENSNQRNKRLSKQVEQLEQTIAQGVLERQQKTEALQEMNRNFSDLSERYEDLKEEVRYITQMAGILDNNTQTIMKEFGLSANRPSLENPTSVRVNRRNSHPIPPLKP